MVDPEIKIKEGNSYYIVGGDNPNLVLVTNLFSGQISLCQKYTWLQKWKHLKAHRIVSEKMG